MATVCKHRCKDKTTCSHLCCKRLPGAVPASTDPAPAPATTSTPAAGPRRRRKTPASEGYVGPLRFLHEWPGAEEVINTNELLEEIITFLAPYEILQCRRVDKHWKAVIENDESKEIRTALFLEAEPYNGRTATASPYNASEGRLLLTDVFPNTALFQGVYQSKDSNRLKKLRFKIFPDCFADEDGMLNMFLTQPPVRTLQGSFYFYKFHHATAQREANVERCGESTDVWVEDYWPFRNDRGLRLRDVVDFLTSFAEEGLGEGSLTDLWRTFLWSRPETGVVLPRVPAWIKRRTETWEDDDAWRKYQKRHKREWTASERAKKGLPPPSRKRKRKTQEEDEVEVEVKQQQADQEDDEEEAGEDIEEDDLNVEV